VVTCFFIPGTIMKAAIERGAIEVITSHGLFIGRFSELKQFSFY
jgi:hypothetical protein